MHNVVINTSIYKSRACIRQVRETLNVETKRMTLLFLISILGNSRKLYRGNSESVIMLTLRALILSIASNRWKLWWTKWIKKYKSCRTLWRNCNFKNHLPVLFIYSIQTAQDLQGKFYKVWKCSQNRDISENIFIRYRDLCCQRIYIYIIFYINGSVVFRRSTVNLYTKLERDKYVFSYSNLKKNVICYTGQYIILFLFYNTFLPSFSKHSKSHKTCFTYTKKKKCVCISSKCLRNHLNIWITKTGFYR